MQVKPLVSVIIPIYNAEKYIEQCIKSVCAQTYTNLEIICIDDYSTDKSFSIIQELSQVDNRIIIIKNEINKGISYTRNIGIHNSHGDYILFLDSDDVLINKAIERLLSEFNNCETDLDIVMASHAEWDGMNIINKRIYPTTVYTNVDNKFNIIESLLLNKWYNSPWNKLFKSRVFDKSNLRFKEGAYHEDAILNYQMSFQIKTIKVISDILYLYRTNNYQSITHKPYNILSKHFITYLKEEYKIIQNYNASNNKIISSNFEDEKFILCIRSYKYNRNLLYENFELIRNLKLGNLIYYTSIRNFSFKRIIFNISFFIPKQLSQKWILVLFRFIK